MQTEPETPTQRKVGGYFLIAMAILAVGIGVGLYFDSDFSLDPKVKYFNEAGAYLVKERIPYQGSNSYYEDVWTGQKYAQSGNQYEMYTMQSTVLDYLAPQVLFNRVNFNLNDTVFLYYRNAYKYSGNDSTFWQAFGDSTISMQEARNRHLIK